jgi:hypothetical protein
MTAVPRNPRVSELRELLRHFRAFRSVYEETGLEEITTPEGNTWSVWDLDYLHSQLHRLTLRQRQAITLCLIHNVRERDAARMMGVSETNPVSMYATLGLQRLLDMVDAGELGRFREQEISLAEIADRHTAAVEEMVKQILSTITEVESGCWLYPMPTPDEPRLLLRSPRAASGFLSVSPLQVLFEHEVGQVPDGSTLRHRSALPLATGCVRPEHAEVVLPTARRQRIAVLAAQYQRSLPREVSR